MLPVVALVSLQKIEAQRLVFDASLHKQMESDFERKLFQIFQLGRKYLQSRVFE
jgi:hypothetical protein